MDRPDVSELIKVVSKKEADLSSVLTPPLINAIQNIPPEYLEMPTQLLKKEGRLTLTDNEIRLAFHREYTSAMKAGRPVRDVAMYRGICGSTYFYNKLLTNPFKMAYILSPVVEYEKKMEAILDDVADRYSELINMDITRRKVITVIDDTGKKVNKEIVELDPQKANVLLTVIKAVEDRVKGSIIQKNLNVNTSQPRLEDGETAELDMDKVNKRIQELEQRLNPYSNKEVIDVSTI